MRALLFIAVVCVLASGCRHEKKKELTEAELNEKLITANRNVTHNESEAIDKYIKEQGLSVKKTGTGLRYIIEGAGTGKSPELGSAVKVKFNLHLIDGTACYESLYNKVQEFTLGKGELPNGFEEGLMLMKTGEKATFILPSHLGFGLTGDGNEIPPRAVLIYEIELIEFK